MTEKQARTLEKLCADLDEHARRVARAGKRGVVPAVLGTGLALASCAGESVDLYGAPAYGAPDGGSVAVGGNGGDGGDGGEAGGGGIAGGGGTVGGGGEGASGVGGVMPPYMAPLA